MSANSPHPQAVASGFTTADAAADAGFHGPGYRPPAAPEPEPTPARSLLGQALHDTFGQTGARLGSLWIGIVAVLGVFAPVLANTHPVVMRLRGGGLSSPMLQHLGAVDVCLFVYFAYALWALTRRLPPTIKLAVALWPVVALAAFVVAWRYGLPAAGLRLFRVPKDAPLDVWTVVRNIAVLTVALVGVCGAVVVSTRFVRSQWRRPGVLLVAGVAAALLCVAAAAVRAPENVVYERYRQLERNGQVDWVVRTLVPYSPNDRLRDQPDAAIQPPSAAHWFGTTVYGEDLLSRILHACRVALTIGIIATGIATVIGIAVGGAMGYVGGTVDLLGMRLVEIVEAIPRLILLLIVTVSFGRSIYLMMVVIGLISWTSDARLIRAEFLKLRNLDFVHAATAAGLGRRSIIFRHMLPNGVAPVLVNASFGVAGAILLESTLSFLGLGLGPDDPSWGQLLDQARAGTTGFVWWLAMYPGLAIFLTVFAYVLIGEAMRDALDPRLRKRD